MFSDLLGDRLFQLEQRAMVTRQEGSNGRLECLGDLLEAHSTDMPEVDDLPIRIGKTVKGTSQRRSVIRPVVFRDGDRICTREMGKHLAFDRYGLTLPPPHLISKPIHRDSHHPGLEPPGFAIVRQLLNDGAEGGLDDLFSQFLVTAVTSNNRLNLGSGRLHELPPSLLVAVGGGCDERGQLVRIGAHALGSLRRWPRTYVGSPSAEAQSPPPASFIPAGGVA